MPTVAELEAQRVTLSEARTSGALSYTDQNGERVEYKSDAQMAAALRFLETEIARLSGRATPRTFKLTSSKGLN